MSDEPLGSTTSTTLCSKCHKDVLSANAEPSSPSYINAIRSGRTPSAEDASHASASLGADKRRIATCEEEIARARAIVETLETRRAVITRRIEEKQCFLSAHRRLPVEIWNIIFTEVCFAEEHSLSIPCPDGDLSFHAPTLVLSHVSFHWRNVVTNLPHLWSSISVTVTEADWVDLLRHYIGTSKDWPLKVFVQQNGPLKAVAASQGAVVLRLLMSQAFRFRELVMTLDNWTILGRLKELDVTFPSLTSFRIRTETTDALGPEYRWLWHAMMRAPRLQMVKTDSWRTYPYQQLRSLEIEKWTDVLSKGFGYLQQCGQLESLTIQRFCPEDDVAVSVNLASVRYLSLGSIVAGTRQLTERLFDSLKFPSLVGLKIGHLSKGAHSALLPMLRRCSASLTALVIEEAVEITDLSVIDILRECPSLTHFSISLADRPHRSAAPTSPIIIEKLMISESLGSPVLVPRLTSLILRFETSLGRFGKDIVKRTAKGVVELIQERNDPSAYGANGVSKLEHVRIRSSCLRRAYLPCRRDCGCNPLFSLSIVSSLEALEKNGTHCVFEGHLATNGRNGRWEVTWSPIHQELDDEMDQS